MPRYTIGLIVILTLGLMTPLVTDAQPPTKILRIGIIEGSPFWDVFRQELRDLGYVEGQTIAIEYRSAEGDLDRLADVATELVRL